MTEVLTAPDPDEVLMRPMQRTTWRFWALGETFGASSLMVTTASVESWSPSLTAHAKLSVPKTPALGV